MILNSTNIKQHKIIFNEDTKKYRDATYDLSIGTIVSMDGKEHESFIIPPRGMVLIVSDEILYLPKNVIGYTTIKNQLSINGILAINVGIVDPSWKNPISSAIINFGNTKHYLSKGDPFLRMTFHKIDSEDILSNSWSPNLEEIDKIKRTYILERKNQSIKSLSETFLSINQIKDEISKKVTANFIRNVIIIGAVLTIFSFLISYTDDFISYRKGLNYKNQMLKIDSLKNQIQQIEKILSTKTDTTNKDGKKKN